MTYYVYIMSNQGNSTLYIGITNDLQRRVREHKTGEFDGFTKKYNVTRLVHFEEYDSPGDAIAREKNLKAWKREWKDRLIDEHNPLRKDLSETWYEDL